MNILKFNNYYEELELEIFHNITVFTAFIALPW